MTLFSGRRKYKPVLFRGRPFISLPVKNAKKSTYPPSCWAKINKYFFSSFFFHWKKNLLLAMELEMYKCAESAASVCMSSFRRFFFLFVSRAAMSVRCAEVLIAPSKTIHFYSRYSDDATKRKRGRISVRLALGPLAFFICTADFFPILFLCISSTST